MLYFFFFDKRSQCYMCQYFVNNYNCVLIVLTESVGRSTTIKFVHYRIYISCLKHWRGEGRNTSSLVLQ